MATLPGSKACVWLIQPFAASGPIFKLAAETLSRLLFTPLVRRQGLVQLPIRLCVLALGGNTPPEISSGVVLGLAPRKFKSIIELRKVVGLPAKKVRPPPWPKLS